MSENIVENPTKSNGFSGLELSKKIKRALKEIGYENPTPIQEKSINPIAKGRDFLGCAQTGTGKTGAFALPVLQRLSGYKVDVAKKPIQALVLAPTRELAIQVGDSFKQYSKYLPIKTGVVFGGVPITPQIANLSRGLDVLVATPGRLLDLHSQGHVNFDSLRVLVLDEADRMLDMGFLPDVKRVLKLLPNKRQNILFSATMPSDILNLSNTLLKNPEHVKVDPVSSTSELVDQEIYFADQPCKKKLLHHLLQKPEFERVIVFTRTKVVASRVSQYLEKQSIKSEAIHGNKSQNARQRALSNFKSGKTRVLVATDIAARGIDVEKVSHVVNYDLPNIPETYVHRIGRTGRATRIGKAISFCSQSEYAYLRDIESLINQKIPVETEHPFHLEIDLRAIVKVPIKRSTGKKKFGGSSSRTKTSEGSTGAKKFKKKSFGKKPSFKAGKKTSDGKDSSNKPFVKKSSSKKTSGKKTSGKKTGFKGKKNTLSSPRKPKRSPSGR